MCYVALMLQEQNLRHKPAWLLSSQQIAKLGANYLLRLGTEVESCKSFSFVLAVMVMGDSGSAFQFIDSRSIRGLIKKYGYVASTVVHSGVQRH